MTDLEKKRIEREVDQLHQIVDEFIASEKNYIEKRFDVDKILLGSIFAILGLPYLTSDDGDNLQMRTIVVLIFAMSMLFIVMINRLWKEKRTRESFHVAAHCAIYWKSEVLRGRNRTTGPLSECREDMIKAGNHYYDEATIVSKFDYSKPFAEVRESVESFFRETRLDPLETLLPEVIAFFLIFFGLVSNFLEL